MTGKALFLVWGSFEWKVVCVGILKSLSSCEWSEFDVVLGNRRKSDSINLFHNEARDDKEFASNLVSKLKENRIKGEEVKTLFKDFFLDSLAKARDRWDVHSTTEISIFIIAKTPCDQQHLFKLFYKNPFTEKPLVLDQFETLLKRGRALMSKLHSSPLLFCWLDISDSTERIPFWSHAISSIKSANIMWLPLNLFNKYAHVFIRNGSKSHSYLSSTSEIREHGSEGAAKIVLESCPKASFILKSIGNIHEIDDEYLNQTKHSFSVIGNSPFIEQLFIDNKFAIVYAADSTSSNYFAIPVSERSGFFIKVVKIEKQTIPETIQVILNQSSLYSQKPATLQFRPRADLYKFLNVNPWRLNEINFKRADPVPINKYDPVEKKNEKSDPIPEPIDATEIKQVYHSETIDDEYIARLYYSSLLSKENVLTWLDKLVSLKNNLKESAGKAYSIHFIELVFKSKILQPGTELQNLWRTIIPAILKSEQTGIPSEFECRINNYIIPWLQMKSEKIELTFLSDMLIRELQMQVVIAQEMLRTLKGGSTSSQKLLESHLFTVDKPFHYLKEFLDNNVDFLCLRMTLRTNDFIADPLSLIFLMESEFLSTIIRHKRYAKHIPEITRQLYQKFTIFSPMHKKPLKRQYSFTQNPVEAPQPKITKSIPKILNSADKRNEQLKKRGVLLFTVQDRAKKEERKKSTQSLNLNPNPVVSRAEPIATCKFYGGSPKKTLNVSKQVDKFIDLKKLDYIYDDDINEDEMFAEEDENFISPTKFKSPGLPNICSINKGTPKANTELNMNVFYSPSFNSPIRTLRFS